MFTRGISKVKINQRSLLYCNRVTENYHCYRGSRRSVAYPLASSVSLATRFKMDSERLGEKRIKLKKGMKFGLVCA